MLEQAQYFTSQKIKITGDIIQHYKFAKQFAIGKRPFGRFKDEHEATGADESISPEANRVKNYKRARRKIIDHINTNANAWDEDEYNSFLPVFLTLTFGDNIADIDEANYEYTKFIRRLNWDVYKTKQSILKYVVVPEFQKRGAIHYHAVLFNLPFIGKEKIETIWGNGFIKIKAIDSIHDVGFYITKYMVKDIADPRLKKHKCYFTSKGLKKPIIVYFEEVINLVKKILPDESLVYKQNDIPIPHLAYMDWKLYNLKNYAEAKQEILKLVNQYSWNT